MPERRQENRKRCFLGARIEFNQRRSTMDCLVRDESDGGARLEVLTAATTLPAEFDLNVKDKIRTRRVELAWRKGDQLGVRTVKDDRFAILDDGDFAVGGAEVDAENEVGHEGSPCRGGTDGEIIARIESTQRHKLKRLGRDALRLRGRVDVLLNDRFGRPVGGLLVTLAAVHGLFAQLLVISRFYG